MNESEIREFGLDWDNVEKAFLWKNLSKDFIRELVEYDPTYKTQLQHHLLCAFHRYASYPSYFYQNMGYYIQNGLAEQKQLINCVDQLYQMYREQSEKEYNSRQIYRLVDGTGRIVDAWTI